MEKNETVNAEFFIQELARMEDAQERRHAALTRRVAQLEDTAYGHSSLEEDPTKMILGMMILMCLIEVGIPLIGQAVRAWRSLPSSPSSD